MNNIFKFAPSELVFDAFVCWTLNFFNEGNQEEKEYAEDFINLIYGKKFLNKTIKVKKIESLEKQYKESLIDVYTKVITEENKIIHLVFEDKTHTSHHSNQLQRHIDSLSGEEGEQIFIYFKIGDIYNEIKNMPEEYIVLDRKTFLAFLKKVELKNDILIMYIDYLEELQKQEHFVLTLIEKPFLTEEEQSILFGSQYGCYKIMERISNEKYDISIGNSFGRPWTNFSIFSDWNPEIELWRGLFWRLDWRSNDQKIWKPYLCLRNYKTNKDTSDIDNEYFKVQREIFKDLEKKYSMLKYGKVHNKGAKEREVGILFFEGDNTVEKIIEIIPKFTEDFIEHIKTKKAFYNI
ncbi:MAG: PD-(D/E)XK nuclease family protein [Fusobacteriaceae bacterium]|nr:PD-(D/E)XK nuclease family protein [Fusobacteriaceae bacterium]